MTKEEFILKMQLHENEFDKLKDKINIDVNEYAESNKSKTMYDLKSIENFTDFMILTGAWVQDRINGYGTVASQDTYKKSVTKKIRKLLGFTY